MTVEVWLIGATYWNRDALSDLDPKFRNTEGYRKLLRTLVRACRDRKVLSNQFVAIGIAAEDKAAISFLRSVDVFKLTKGYLVAGSIANFLKDIKRKPKSSISIQICNILEHFK